MKIDTTQERQGFGTGATGWIALSFALLLPLLMPPPARAADAPGVQFMRFGTVQRIHGEVSATAPLGGGERRLREGDVLHVGERVRAAATAEAVLRTDDAGMIAVRPGSDFVAERFAAEGKASDNMAVRIFTGSLRIITGWISRVAAPNHRILTPTATIGVRGTDHEPYVLSGEMAAEKNAKPGTYDKVNRGATTMVVGDHKLDIGSGQVGFVREADGPGEQRAKTRLLMTILMPVLLEKVPDFYVPGRFDAEVDRYSENSGREVQRELAKKRAGAAAPATCDAGKLARAWLGQLDAAAMKRNAAGILAKFAPEVKVRATVRNQDGTTTSVEIGRDELAQSTVAAIKGLSQYRHRRVSIEATAVEGSDCGRLAVKSVVIEQGRQSGKAYRFESLEEYVLESRDGRWLAVEAATTQR